MTTTLNTMFSSGFYMPGNFLGTMSDFVGLGSGGAALEAAGGAGAASEAAGAASAASAAGDAADESATRWRPRPPGVGELGSAGAVSAALGRGAIIGALAVTA